jgi:hypothetical protein
MITGSRPACLWVCVGACACGCTCESVCVCLPARSKLFAARSQLYHAAQNDVLEGEGTSASSASEPAAPNHGMVRWVEGLGK